MLENHWRALRGLELLAGTTMPRLRRKIHKIGTLVSAWGGRILRARPVLRGEGMTFGKRPSATGNAPGR